MECYDSDYPWSNVCPDWIAGREAIKGVAVFTSCTCVTWVNKVLELAVQLKGVSCVVLQHAFQLHPTALI